MNPSWGGAIVSPQAAAAQRGVVCLSRMAAAIWGLAQHWDAGATLSVLSPKPPSPVSPQVFLVHSALPLLPGIYCLWLSPSVVNLVNQYSAVRLKHHRVRADTLLGSGLLFPLRLFPLRREWSDLPRWLLLFGG